MYLYNIRAALEQLEHIPDSGGSVLSGGSMTENML